ncbi:MAG: hypothetical protein A2126_00090 [Candidatus Woykebacteria bacterium GWB1_45_5]|uniref:Lipid A biosynthesis acyltransferase n=1 Tax=Candidatus Woykebacteria bacterium GWB1_45_5 TaxID=1802592 RepID=A0A1G1W6J8_9BACT|nr:MAG: hypothetical protein A2126_00090 [Candidatus Woykebacteria bacterium GWB1_45_5]
MGVLKLPWRVIKRPTTGLGGFVVGAFAWLVYWCSRWFPNKTRYRLFLVLAWAITLVWYGAKRRIIANLRLIRPDLDQKALQQSCRENIKDLVLNWTEVFGRKQPDLEELKGRIEGARDLLRYYRCGRKIVVVFPHTGPIHELASAVAAFDVKVFVPPVATPRLLFHLMARLRRRYGDIEFERIRKGETIERCEAKLSEGRIVILAIDMLRPGGVPCKIGEAVGYFPVGPVRLALLGEAAVFPVFPFRDKEGRARLIIGEPFTLLRTGDLAADTVVNTKRLVEGVYGQFLRNHCSTWWRLLWSKLSPAEEEKTLSKL